MEEANQNAASLTMQTLYIEEIDANESDQGSTDGVGTLKILENQDNVPQKQGQPSSKNKKKKRKNKGKRKQQQKHNPNSQVTQETTSSSQLPNGARFTSATLSESDGPSRRGGCSLTAVMDGEKLFAFGGADRTQAHSNDLYQFDIPTGKWQQVATEGSARPAPRSGHTAVAYGKKIIVFGGLDLASEKVYEDIWIYDIGDLYQPLSLHSRTACYTLLYSASTPEEGGAWREVADVAGCAAAARNEHAAALAALAPLPGAGAGGEGEGDTPVEVMVVFGGSSPDVGPMDDLLLLFLEPGMERVSWRDVGTLGDGPCARELHTLAITPGRPGAPARVLVGGGRGAGGEALRDLYALDTATWMWSRLEDPPSARLGACAALISLMKENEDTQTVNNDFMPPLPPPSSATKEEEGVGKSGNMGTAQQELWVFGGVDTTAGAISNSLMVYHLGKNCWSAPVLYPVPIERFGHASCCIGETMYIFGGVNMESDLQDLFSIFTS